MKYAITGPRGRIFRILDTPNNRTVEISDELAEKAATMRGPILFEGDVTSRESERENGFRLRWDEDAETWVRSAIVIPPAVAHDNRLRAGFEYGGETYPALKKDRDGINAVIAGFRIADQLFNEWIAANGPPQTEKETMAMIESGAIPPEFRATQFEWSDGRFTLVNPTTAVEIAGKMSLLVSRSFIQKQAESIT